MADTAPLLLTIPETAATLKLGQNTVYRLIACGQLDTVDVSLPGSRKSKTRVPHVSIERFIERRTRNRRSLRTA